MHARISVEEGMERLLESEVVGNFKKMVVFRHRRAVAHINSIAGITACTRPV